jgi:hypothetical protein
MAHSASEIDNKDYNSELNYALSALVEWANMLSIEIASKSATSKQATIIYTHLITPNLTSPPSTLPLISIAILMTPTIELLASAPLNTLKNQSNFNIHNILHQEIGMK